MNILYFSVSYIPSRRANGVQTMRMCAAFCEAGHRVRLVKRNSPGQEERNVEDIHSFYGVEPSFQIRNRARPPMRGGERVYRLAIVTELLRSRAWVDVVYARDLHGALAATLLGLPTIFEVHEVPHAESRRKFSRLMARRSLLHVVTISDALRRDLRELGLLPAETSVIVAHSGGRTCTSQRDFIVQDSVLGTRSDRSQAAYIGSLYPGKGLEVLLSLAARMPDWDFHIVGGTDREIQVWRADTGHLVNVSWHGFIEPSKLEGIYPHFSAFLLPTQPVVFGAGGRQNLGRWNSPLKLFEYMGSGVPIVASDLPVLREVLADGHNALLVPPGDIAGWESALRTLQSNPSLRTYLGDQANIDLENEYSYSQRAKRVLRPLSTSEAGS